VSFAPILIVGYGNPGRGDDGLGPAFVEAVEQWELPNVETVAVMQLQIELVLDLYGRYEILFVDATAEGKKPFSLCSLEPRKDGSYTSHAMHPAALLHGYRQLYQVSPPQSRLLAIRGENFALGDELSPIGRANLAAALATWRARICGKGHFATDLK